MRTNKFAVCASLALMMVAGFVSANELVTTADTNSKSGSSFVALDFVNSGEATAFEFEVVVPAGVKVDTSACVSELPATHAGACKFNEKNGRVVVMVFSDTNALLPEGVVPIGRLGFSGQQLDAIKAENILVSDVNAKKLDAGVSSSSEL